jgi:recombination protein RecA
MSPTLLRSHNQLETEPRSSYFIRVSNHPVSRYDYAAWPERTTTNRKDVKKMAVSTSQDENKKKALGLAIAQIEKSCGKGSIMRLGADQKVRIESISTGAINLDAAIGVGGIPRGRVTEIYGPESSGKTTLCLHVVANAQKNGGVAAYIDAEHALDTDYARKLGVDVEALLISQPDTGEQALEICEILVRSGAVDVVVIDSVAALVPKAEIEGDMGDSHVGLQARLMSQALRKLTGSIARSKTSVIFINQLREKIGVMFGNPETTTGGKALKFYASVRLDIRRIGPVKDKEDVVGSHVRVKVVKNKVAAPFKQAEFDIMYAEGISHASLVLDIAAEANIIDKSGAWYSYNGQKIGQGRENAKLYLKDSPALMAEVEEKVKALLGVGPRDVVSTELEVADAEEE